MAGITETKEVFIAANEIGVYIASKLKDGFDVSDATDFVAKLIGDSEFQNAIKVAVEGINEVPGEVADLDLSEGLQLAGLALAYVPKYVEALKKED